MILICNKCKICLPLDETECPMCKLKASIEKLSQALQALLSYHYHNDNGVKPKEYHNAVKALKTVNNE